MFLQYTIYFGPGLNFPKMSSVLRHLPVKLSWSSCGLSHSEVWNLSEGVWLTNMSAARLHQDGSVSRDNPPNSVFCPVSFPKPLMHFLSISSLVLLFFFTIFISSSLIFSLRIIFLEICLIIYLLLSLISPSSRKAERKMSVLNRQKEECVVKEERTRHYMGAVISVAEHISQERDQLIKMVLLIFLILYSYFFYITWYIYGRI